MLGHEQALAENVDAEDLVNQALERVTNDGYDEPTVLAMALERMAEAWAQDARPLCPECGQRRMSRGKSVCPACAEQRQDLLAKRLRWWNAHGAEWSAARKRRGSDDA